MMESRSTKWRAVMSRNTHVISLTNLSQFRTCHTPCHTPRLVPPQNSSALEALLSQLHHRLLRFLEFSSALELGNHQYCPQYFCLKFSPSSCSCPYSCSCSYPVFRNSIPVFPLLYTPLSCVPIHIPICSCS